MKRHFKYRWKVVHRSPKAVWPLFVGDSPAKRLKCMFTYSKLAQAGIAAVSYLATVANESRLAGSAEIAESRQLSRQLVAKILTLLSSAGIVVGRSGPAGGYQLARPASEITLLDVVKVFEDLEDRVMCPFGPNWCGVGPHCPLHDTLREIHQQVLDRLARETFAQFETSPA